MNLATELLDLHRHYAPAAGTPGHVAYSMLPDHERLEWLKRRRAIAERDMLNGFRRVSPLQARPRQIFKR